MHERYSSDNAMSSSDQESNVIIMDSQGLLKSLKKSYQVVVFNLDVLQLTKLTKSIQELPYN